MIDLIPRFRKKKIPALREYRVPVCWEMWGILTVKAHTRKEAMEFALSPEAPLPADNYYVDNSVEVDRKGVEVCDADETGEEIFSPDELEDCELPDANRSVRLFWDDLTAEARQKILALLGNNGNYDIFPITEIMKGEAQ